ncbi:Zinc finger RING-type [Arabidopsis suecica]|uniref:Zinc finger RING-type n=1 Tax=Arabidopsis suecica TaxID=45249 RepID=A0A8T1ZFN5_ARASU|nr:Zinc finger RING-type [Arabidopsis suecica]
MELDFDASNLVEDEAAEVEHNDMAGIEGERCGICMDIIIDRGVLDCCQHWFCFECIDNWSTIMNLCPLCQREFQLITCVPVYDSGESSKVDEVSLSGDEDCCIEEETDAVSSPSHYIDETHYIDENAVICLDGDLCKIRNTFSYIGGDSNLDTSIACDSCDTWYHAICVGFDVENASEDTWVCPRCLSSEKSHEPDTSPMETQPDTSPVETRKSLDISEKTNSGCSAEAVYSGNFSVTVADEGETALVVSIVKGDESHMEPSDTNPLPVEAKMDGDPDSLHLKILCREENTEQVPVKSELKQSLPHDISSRLSSDSYQPFFAADMENRADPVVEKDCLSVDDKNDLSTTAISNSDVPSVVSLKRKHPDCSGDDGNSETKPEIYKALNKPKLEEEEELATFHHESRSPSNRSPSNNTTVDIFSIVKGTGRRKSLMRSNPTDKSSEGENAAGLRVKKIKRTPEDEQESMVLVEKLRKEIREAVRNKSMEDITENQFDPKLLAAFRAAVAGPKTEEAPRKISALAVKAKKLMLQKGKVRENLTKKIYADLNGKRKSAWHRDCEVEFWKHRCIQSRKPEKIETLKSVLSLLKKKPGDAKINFSSETPQASNPILSRLYLADTSVFPRNDNLKPLLAPKEMGNSQNNAKPTEANKTLPKISDAKGSKLKAAGSKLNSGNKQSDGQPNLTSSNSKEMFDIPDDLKKDKRKWALQVLARKKALAGNNSTQDREGSPELKGNYPLLAQLPADMRPSLATSRHNKVPVAVRQTQLYRLTEHFLKKENLLSVRRSAATELAVADAINIEKAIADKSSSKVVYMNLCSQEILHHSESKTMDNAVEPNSSSQMAVNESERISGKDSDDPAVLQALRAAGLADSPPNSPTRSTEVPPEKVDSSLDKTREAGPYNVLDMDSVPDTDIFGDFEYELDEEDYIGATVATKASVTQPDESLTKVKVVLSTVQPGKSLNQSEVVGDEETTENQKETTNGKEDGKSFVPMEPVPEAEGEGEGEGGGEILSVAECEELYGPGTEKLVEKPLIEGFAENGVKAKAPDSECESNTHREFIASNFEIPSIQEKKIPRSIQKCKPSEKQSKEEKGKADGFSNSITKKVEIYIKEHIRPLCKSGVINVEQYRWAVTKTTEKVMKYHSKAKSANFLIKEGDKIKKLAEQYVETASSGAHHKDKDKGK